MAISDTQKLDYLWKKIGYGVAKTDTDTAKKAYEETISSPLLLRGDRIWQQSASIPASKPSTTTGVVQVYKDGVGSWTATVECTEDLTSADNKTWKTNLTDWISVEFGSTYLVEVYIDSSGSTTAQTTGTKIFSAGSGNNDEWYFDCQSGVLNFIGSTLPTAIASGVTGKSIYVSGARYVGLFGIGTTSDLTSTTANLGNLNITDITISSVNTNSNIVVDPNGSGNIQLSANTSVTGNLSASNANLGNAATANFFIGNGALLTSITGANVTGIVANATYAETTGSSGSASSAATSYKIANGTSNVNIVTVDGNVTVGVSGNAGIVTITGTGVNVAGYINTGTGNIIVGNANLGNAATANYFIGSGANLTSIPGGNVSGAVGLATYATTANAVSGSNVSGAVGLATYATTANAVSGSNVSGAVALATYATTANAVAGANVSGEVSYAAVANSVSGSNVSGAVALATYATTANAVSGSNVSGAVALATYATTANAVSGSNVSGEVSYAAVANSVSGSNVSGAVTYATTANAVSGSNVSGAVTYATTANAVSGSNVSGEVSYAAVANSVSGSNVSGQVGNALVAGTVYSSAQSNITSVGTLTDISVSGNAVIGGNLTISGTTTTVNSTNTRIIDPMIELGGGANGAALITDDNKDRGTILHYYSGGAPIDAFMGWDDSNVEFSFGSNVSIAGEVVTFNSLGNVRANHFIGDGSLLTGLTAGSSDTAITVTASSQPNITSVGTLVSLAITGNLSAGNANLGN